MDSLRSMSIRAALGLVALVFSAGAAAQINPNQIGWTVGTTGCSTATYPWVPADNACEAPGGGGGGLAGVNLQTTSYSAVSGDNGKMVYFNLAGPGTLTLPSPPSSTWAVLASDSWSSLAPLTVAWPSGTTLDGYASSCTAQANPGMGGWIFTDGTNYFTRSGAVLTFSCVVPSIVQSVLVHDCGFGTDGDQCPSVSYSAGISPGNALVLDLFHTDSGSTVSVTDNQGDTFVETNTMYGGGTWVACGAHGGPTTISFTNNYNLAAAYEIANTTTSSCVDAYNQGSSTTSAVLSTGSIVRAQPYDFLFVSAEERSGSNQTFTEANGYSVLETSPLVDGALNYESWGQASPAAGSVSDTITSTSSSGDGFYAGILALKPGAAATLITGDLIVAGPNGQPQPLKHGPAGTVMTSNGEGAVPSDQAIPPFKWPPSAAGPTFSPAAGSYGTGVSVTDTCPGSATPWISAGTTPVAGATGITLTASSTLYGSCQGNGYLTTAAAGYTVTPGFTVTNNGYVNGSGSSVTSATLSTFSTALTNPSVIFVEEYAVGTPSSFPVPTDTASNTYVDCGPGKILYNSSAVTLECFYALNTHTTASNIVTIHASSSVTYMNGTAFEVTGGATSSPIDGGSGVGYSSLANGTGGSSGANALYGNAITPAGSGDLIIGMFAGANAIPTAGTSPNAYTAVNVSAHAVSEYFYQLVSASIDATAGSTYSGDSYGNITVALKP